MKIFTDEVLNEFMDFIRGNGKYGVFFGGIHTHPGYDKNQDDIHAICEELERRGLVCRYIDEPGHAYFRAA